MKDTIYVGLVGYRRSGKSTLAKNAQTFLSGVDRASLAAPVKEAAAICYGRPVEEFLDDDLKNRTIPGWGITYRQAMIHVGTAMRGVDEDHWIKHLHARAHGGIVLIDDLRYLNEASRVDLLVRVAVMPGEPAPQDEPELEDVFKLCSGIVNEANPALQVKQLKDILESELDRDIYYRMGSRGFTF